MLRWLTNQHLSTKLIRPTAGPSATDHATHAHKTPHAPPTGDPCGHPSTSTTSLPGDRFVSGGFTLPKLPPSTSLSSTTRSPSTRCQRRGGFALRRADRQRLPHHRGVLRLLIQNVPSPSRASARSGLDELRWLAGAPGRHPAQRGRGARGAPVVVQARPGHRPPALHSGQSARRNRALVHRQQPAQAPPCVSLCGRQHGGQPVPDVAHLHAQVVPAVALFQASG